MDLISRYVYAVTNKLPEKQRADVARELTSDIAEMVGDRTNSSKLSDEKKIKEVLVALGNPELLAARYQEKKRYLIGPPFFDMYMTLLKNLLLIVPVTVAAITLIVGLTSTNGMGRLIIDAIGAAITVGIHIFFWLTVIFVLIERSDVPVSGKKKQSTTLGVWNPDDLPAIPRGVRIPKGEAISGIVWSALAVLGTLWQIPAIHTVIAPNVTLILSEDIFWPHWAIPLLIISIASLIVEIVRFKVGIWNKLTTSLIVVLDVVVAAVFASMLVLFKKPISQEFIDTVAREDNAARIEQVAGNIFVIFCLTIIALCVYEMIRAIWAYRTTKQMTKVLG